MERAFQIAELNALKNLENYISQVHPICKVYIFGSFLWSNSWNDIDILIIYDEYHSCFAIKNFIISNFFDIPFDLLFLTHEEELKLNFIVKKNARQIRTIDEFR